MKWESLHTKGHWFYGTVTCFEHEKDGWAIVKWDDGRTTPVRRRRLVAFDPKAKFSAKGGGDDPAGSPAIIAEVA